MSRVLDRWFGIVVFLISVMIQSCVSESGVHGIVVERSKKFFPSWAKAGFGSVQEQGDLLKVVTIKKNVLDLTLGIEQAKELAIIRTTRLIVDRLNHVIDDIAADHNIVELRRNFLVREELRIFGLNYASKLRPIDFYFEVYERPQRDSQDDVRFSSVFVLMYFDRKEYAAFASDVKKLLLSSSDPNYNLIGEKLSLKKI